MPHKTHSITIGSVHRELPLFKVKSGLEIAVLNILGDVELVEAAAAELAPRIAASSPRVLVTPEAKSIPLAYALAADRKSTRLNSSHVAISYAVFCLTKK